MAKLRSPVWSTIRGSIAGTTYMTGTTAQIVARQRTNPVQPNTPQQSEIRSIVATLNVAWKDVLTEVQRSNWNLYASTCVFQGPVSQYTIPGRLIFIAGLSLVKLINLRGYLVIPETLTAPTEPGFYNPGGIEVDQGHPAGTGFRIIVNNFGSHTIAVFYNVSPAQSPGRYFYKGPWDKGLTNAFSAPFGASTNHTITGLIANKAYFVRVKSVVSDGPHAISTSYYFRVIAKTNP